MKRLLGNQKFWAVLGAGLLVAAVSGSAFARQLNSRNLPRPEARQDIILTTSISPLPAPAVQPTPESENEVEFTGVVEAMAADSWVIDGRTVLVTATTEIKPGLISVAAATNTVRPPITHESAAIASTTPVNSTSFSDSRVGCIVGAGSGEMDVVRPPS